MRKRSASHDLDTFPIIPRGINSASGFQKGWASERVMTFNSGRTVPSKWEDAERWICSPLNGKTLLFGSHQLQLQLQPQPQPPKRPKSKSGPIIAANPPNVVVSEGGSLKNFPVNSPFSTGVLAADSVYCAGLGAPSTGVHDWPDLNPTNYCCPSPKISLSSESNEEVMNLDEEKSLETEVSQQRDMATQMSPRECSRCSHSSTVGRSSFAASPPTALISITEAQSHHFAKLEVRDVEVDKRATSTTIRWSRKHGIRMSRKGRHGANEFNISEAAADSSKWQREEAKITAWENLQKAKAEAAIRKLEMELEKKRSATMDKIVDKLRTAEFKARRMRNKLSDGHIDDREPYQVLRTSRKLFAFPKYIRVGSFSRLFMCRSF